MSSPAIQSDASSPAPPDRWPTGRFAPVVIFQCIAIIVLATFIPAAAGSWGMTAEPLGAQSWEWVHGAARLIATVVVVWFLHRQGWLGLAGLNSIRLRLGEGRRRTLAWAIVALLAIATLLPAVGLLTTSWSATGAIASYLWYYGITGPFEEVLFRGVIFVALAVFWSDRADGLRLAALVSALLFGISHVAPIAILLTSVVAFALTGLMVATRSLWPAIIAHSVYDILAQFPLDAAGVSMEGWQLPAAFAFYAAAAILTWFLLSRPQNIYEVMRAPR